MGIHIQFKRISMALLDNSGLGLEPQVFDPPATSSLSSSREISPALAFSSSSSAVINVPDVDLMHNNDSLLNFEIADADMSMLRNGPTGVLDIGLTLPTIAATDISAIARSRHVQPAFSDFLAMREEPMQVKMHLDPIEGIKMKLSLNKVRFFMVPAFWSLTYFFLMPPRESAPPSPPPAPHRHAPLTPVPVSSSSTAATVSSGASSLDSSAPSSAVGPSASPFESSLALPDVKRVARVVAEEMSARKQKQAAAEALGKYAIVIEFEMNNPCIVLVHTPTSVSSAALVLAWDLSGSVISSSTALTINMALSNMQVSHAQLDSTKPFNLSSFQSSDRAKLVEPANLSVGLVLAYASLLPPLPTGTRQSLMALDATIGSLKARLTFQDYRLILDSLTAILPPAAPAAPPADAKAKVEEEEGGLTLESIPEEGKEEKSSVAPPAATAASAASSSSTPAPSSPGASSLAPCMSVSFLHPSWCSFFH